MNQNVPKIIAICGLKRTGKDTIADYLCKNYGYTKIRISNPLKQGLKVMFGFTDEQLETDMKDVVDERWGVEPRKVMQFIGTDIMQYQINEILPTIGRNFWIKSLIEEHFNRTNNKDDTNHNLFVISDLRFHHEYELLSKYNTVFWRVERMMGDGETLMPTQDCHLSEKEYLDIPVSNILNNSDIHDLYRQIDTTFARYISQT